jgi:hypothetical protein
MGRISALDWHFYDSCKNLSIGISILISCSSTKCIMMNIATSLYAKETEPAYDNDEWLHRRNSADSKSAFKDELWKSMPTILSWKYNERLCNFNSQKIYFLGDFEPFANLDQNYILKKENFPTKTAFVLHACRNTPSFSLHCEFTIDCLSMDDVLVWLESIIVNKLFIVIAYDLSNLLYLLSKYCRKM